MDIYNQQIELDNIFLFKVKDYTTILLGRYDDKKGYFYVQRGDGEMYKYTEDRIVWKQKLECEFYRNFI